jgi:hypothetical protein
MAGIAAAFLLCSFAWGEPFWGARSSALILNEMQYSPPDALPIDTPSYSETWERKPWGPDSFLKRELNIFRGSIEDIRQLQMSISALQLLMHRIPLSENFALYGENSFQTFAYPQHDSRVSPTLERRSLEIRTAIGVEWVYRQRIRFRLPLFLEQKQYRRWDHSFGPMSEWRHGVWLAPELAIATTPNSELLFTTSTLSFVNADLSRFSLVDGLTTHWYQVLFRTAI